MIKNHQHKFMLRVVLFLCISFIGAFWTASYYKNKHISQNELYVTDSLKGSLSELTREIRQALEIYSLELNTIRSFIYSTGLSNLSHSLFQEYAKHSDFEGNYPGARGFGFIRYVDISQEASFLEEASRDRQEDFSIRFLSEYSSNRFVIQYIEPEYKNTQAIGLDIGSESHRRNAALSAARKNVQTLTAPITLVQANAMVKHGFLLLLPVFDLSSASQTNSDMSLLGWTYAPLLIDEIIAAIQQKHIDLHLQISDVTAGDSIEFFKSQLDQQESAERNMSHSVQLSLFGREWKMTANPKRAYIDSLSLASPTDTYYKVLGLFVLGILFVGNALYLVRKHFLSLRQKTELAAVVENGIEGTVGLDEKFCLKYWNESAKQLFAFSDSSLGKPFLDWLIGAYSADYLIDLFNRISKGESIKHFELTLSDAEEQAHGAKNLNLNFQPIFQDNAFLGVNVSMVDVTEVRALQGLLEDKNQQLNDKLTRQGTQLKQSTSLHHSLIQGADFLIISTDLRGVITSSNRKLEELLDYTQEEILGDSITRIMSAKYLSVLGANVFQTFKYVSKNLFDCLVYPLKHQSRVNSDGKFVHKNGSEVDLQLTVSAITDDDSKVLGYLFVADDVREQKALKFDLELVSSVVHNSEEILLWLDFRGAICKSNPFARTALGYSEYELRRLNIIDLLPFDVDEVWQNQFKDIQSSVSTTTEKSLTTYDGNEIPCLISISKLHIEGDDFLFLSAKDISERLAKERVLEDALSIAAQANQSKDQFLANMGHELRTPLNEVNGSLQLMQLTDLSTVQSDYLTQAKTSVRALTQSIDDVLDCGEIIRNKLTLQNEDLDLLALFDSVGHACAIIAEDKNIEVHFDIAEDVPNFIHSDPHRLYQLLMCLMNNAVKFTFEGDVLLKCTLGEVFDDQCTLNFQVIDSGVGISKEKQSEIFEFFSQAEMSANRAYGGLGLGLTISKTIVELMSGCILCESTVGVGSTFSFNAVVGKVESADVQENVLKNVDALRVLIVDDNEISLSVLSRLIQQLGWEVVTATGSDAAVDQLSLALEREEGFDLALIDWNMPEKSGIDLVKDIRTQFSVKDMPILVMVTAYTRKMLSQVDNRDVEHLLSAFLTKPVSRAMLIDLVNSVIGSDKKGFTTLNPASRKLDSFRVLLVEDNETNQFIAKNLLQSQGAIVAVASEGEAAWNILNEQPDRFDIVLMDIQMPGWDGYRATKEIRADERFADLPILAMTANVLATDKRKCFDVGMNGHIGKPFELTQLVQEIVSLARKPKLLMAHKIASEKALKNNESTALPASSEEVSSLASDALVLLKEKLGVNVNVSLNRFAGSEELYMKSLVLFLKDIDTYLNALTVTDNELTFEGIKPIFHTLKGTSGLLGFTNLENLAMECDQLASMLATKGPKTEPLASLIQLMQSIKYEIELIFEQSNIKLASKSENVGLIDSKKMALLRRQLKDSNMQAAELYSELNASIAALSVDIAESLEDAISKLDFKVAINLLDNFKQKYAGHIDE